MAGLQVPDGGLLPRRPGLLNIVNVVTGSTVTHTYEGVGPEGRRCIGVRILVALSIRM